jgi:hypothetical protein
LGLLQSLHPRAVLKETSLSFPDVTARELKRQEYLL